MYYLKIGYVIAIFRRVIGTVWLIQIIERFFVAMGATVSGINPKLRVYGPGNNVYSFGLLGWTSVVGKWS